MKKITIIGGSGFVGTRLMDYLKDDSNYKLHNIDLLPSQFFPQFTELGDVRSQEDLDRMLKGTDIVVLLAAQHRDDVEPTSLYYETNVEGMKVTLRAMEKNGVKMSDFRYAFQNPGDFDDTEENWILNDHVTVPVESVARWPLFMYYLVPIINAMLPIHNVIFFSLVQSEMEKKKERPTGFMRPGAQ